MPPVPSSLTRALAKLKAASAAASTDWFVNQFELGEACYAFVAECGAGGRDPSPWTQVRRDFAEQKSKAGWTWQRIYDAYIKKHPGDKDASADTIRLACHRKR